MQEVKNFQLHKQIYFWQNRGLFQNQKDAKCCLSHRWNTYEDTMPTQKSKSCVGQIAEIEIEM